MSEFIERIPALIQQLRDLIQVNVLSLWSQGKSPDCVTDFYPVNEKGHLSWSAGGEVLELSQKLVIPEHLSGYPLTGLSLRLVLTWWADRAVIFVKDRPVHEGDLFDASVRLLLSESIQPGEEFEIRLQLTSPGHDRGALMRSQLLFEWQDLPQFDPGFFADELAILEDLGQKLLSESTSPTSWHEVLHSSLHQIEWENVGNAQKFGESLQACRQNLSQKLEPFLHNHPTFKLGKIVNFGHAHLDLAWLWPIAETWEVAKSTFKSVFTLQKDFPELIFGHTTPALYEWIEIHEPELFNQIQIQVKQGKWEIIGGLWVEPDLNLIDGESMVRQVLYGQLYTQEKFGQPMKIAWLPDTFGFTWQLPQILQKAGIDYFVTQKLRWNDTTPFPHALFWWESPDGSRILSLMSAPIGEGIDPVKMGQYWSEWYTQTGYNQALWLVGVGDHGGGPSRDMLEIGQRWQNSSFLPPCEFKKVIDYFQEIPLSYLNQLPIWRNELYLQFHRGCYTTHADQKRWNRRCEQVLYQAELFASLSTLLTQSPYPKSSIETAWKTTLFHQFHDILPGSSIAEVYETVNPSWQKVFNQTQDLLNQALQTLSQYIPLPLPPHPHAQPIIIWNPLNWCRSQVVSIPLSDSTPHGTLYTTDGEIVPTQISNFGNKSHSPTLLFFAPRIPSIGYGVFWWVADPLSNPDLDEKCTDQTQSTISIREKMTVFENTIFGGEEWGLETDRLRVMVDGETGNLISIFDKLNQQEILGKSGGNLLEAFQDQGQYWDSWNIAPDYQNHPLPQPLLKEIHWRERGEIRQRLRVIRQIGESLFHQDYVLDIHSPYLVIETQVDWRETHVLVKAGFNWAFESEKVTGEIPCGVIERGTRPQTPEEKAQWEVPGLRWVDHCHGSYGVSVLNDCKYGYDVQPQHLRLSLLRGSTWPDEKADQGEHDFCYGIYPHSGNWQSGETVKRGYEFNFPLLVQWSNVTESISGMGMGEKDRVSLLEFSDDSVILMALKPGESDAQSWILRLYESQGKTVDLSLGGISGLKLVAEMDLLEKIISHHSQLSPFSISTFQVKVNPQTLSAQNLE